MSKNEVKKVSNLTVKIGKAMDIISTKDFNTIYKNLYLFKKIDEDLTTQIKKYARYPDHELDFTVNDLVELSTSIYEFLINFPQKFLYSKHKKYFDKLEIISGEDFNKFTLKYRDELRVDIILREIYRSLSYKALMYDIWSNSSDKKSFSDQITDLLRSFL
jgi:hypothetical protein